MVLTFLVLLVAWSILAGDYNAGHARVSGMTKQELSAYLVAGSLGRPIASVFVGLLLQRKWVCWCLGYVRVGM